MKTARRWILGFFFLLISGLCSAQSVQVITFPALQQLLNRPTDSVLVVSFWATWCKPCVEELPLFDRLSAQYASRKVNVVLINLDGLGKLEQRVRPFLAKKPLTSAKVLLLNSGSNNDWIDQVDANWSGSLPFTVFINPRKKQRKAFEQPITWTELETEVRKINQ